MELLLQILLTFCACALSGGQATNGHDGNSQEFQEYHYNLPVKETHSHVVTQVYPKGKSRQHAPAPSVTSALDQHDLYGGSVAAAVAAAQQAHAQRYTQSGPPYADSHYTKPGSVGLPGVTNKASALSYSPAPLASSYGAVAGPSSVRVGLKKSATAKKPTTVGIPHDAEGAHGYLHGNYAGVGGYGGYAGVGHGYGYSMGYPGVGYRNPGAGFGQYGYSGFPYGGHVGGGGGLGYGHGYHAGGVLGGYGGGEIGAAGYGLGGAGGYGHGGYGGGVAAYPALTGYGLAPGYGLGGGYGLGHGGIGGGYGLGHGGIGHGGIGGGYGLGHGGIGHGGIGGGHYGGGHYGGGGGHYGGGGGAY